MNLYFAPMEGITGYIYRNAYHTYFPSADKYFTPFLSPNKNRYLSSKDIKDILPEHNKEMHLVPQILTNNAQYFIGASKELQEEYGYNEVNLNLGCPSGTVVTKGKGAGFLVKKEELTVFLEQVFENTDLNISIKTRIGLEEPGEFYELLEIFNQYPLYELIIHPRVRTDYYKNKPNMEIFSHAVRASKNPLCYNGDIFTKQDYEKFCTQYPGIKCVMLGRGLLMDPFLAERLRGNEGTDRTRLKAFHDRLYADYQEELSGNVNVLFKMKEFWFNMIQMFPDSDRYMKKIKKASKLYDYEEAVERLFAECEMK